MPRSRRSLAVLVILLLGFAGLTALHAPGALAASGTVTVTANGSPAGVNARVVVLTGAKETGGASVGGSNTSGAPHFSLTPNASSSLPLFALYDQTGGSSGEYTAEPSNSFTFNGTTDNGKQHDAFADGQYTGTVTGGTAVTLGSTTPTSSDKQVWAAYEIEAAGGSSPAVDTSTPALVFSSSANSVTTASFTPPAGAVLAVLASGNNASSIAVSDSGLGLTWTKRASNFAGGGGSVVYTATVPAAAQAPVVVTKAATSVTSSGATLNGSVNPEGQGTTYKFDYGTTTGYGTSVPSPAGSAGSGTSAVNENSAVTGLSASTTYHYRIEATNATGTTFGSDQQFTTTGQGTAPAVSSFTPTSGPSGTSVTITGSGFTGATAVKFNGTTATFTVTSDTQITATVPAAATTGPVAVTTPAGTGTSTATFTVTATGQTRKIVVIVEENESRSDIVGNTGQAPYLNQLIANGKLFTNYTEASGNGSLLNYLAMTGGETTAPVPNIFQAIDSAGGTLTWKEFMESMGGNCATGSTANVPGTSDSLYTASHDPGFQDQVTDTCSTNDVPLTSSTFNPASLPDFSYVVPNECNDMHTLPTNGQACPAYFGSNPGTSQINIGDNWLAAVVPSLLAQPNVTVLITWDEGRVDNTVTTIEVGAGVTPGSTDGNAYNHYNLEAGLYNYFGLGTAPGNGATATPLPFPTRTP